MSITGSSWFLRVWSLSVGRFKSLLPCFLPDPHFYPHNQFLIPFPPFLLSKQENVTVNPPPCRPKFLLSLSSGGLLLWAIILLLDSCHYLCLKVIAKLNKRKAVFSCRCTKAVLTSLIQFAEG